MFFIQALLLLVLLGYLSYKYFTRTFDYWQSRNIPGPRPIPLFGNIKDFILRKSSAAVLHKQIYDKYTKERVVGIFSLMSPSLIVRDLDIAKYVLIKDFEFFEDRGIEFSKKGLGANLFHSNWKIWRPLRNLFTPLFTTLKMKNMIPMIIDISDIYINYLKQLTETQKDQNVYLLIQKFSMLSISACAFGLDIGVNCDAFMKQMEKIDQMSFSRSIAADFNLLCPGVLQKLKTSIFPKEVNDFFLGLVDDIMLSRNGIPSNRKDFIDLILEAKSHGDILETKKKLCDDSAISYVELTKEVIAAQAFIFYVAGYETSATTIAFMMYELAMNSHIQNKLLAEVDESLRQHNGMITYEMISQLSYLDKVLNETLRKYPPSDIQRRAKADYKIPGTNIVIEKGTIVFVPTLAISYDEKYFPDPMKFDPERFSPENENKRHSCAFIPFGTGPRNCIGMPFAKIQTRVFLIKLLSSFRIEASKNTSETITLDPERIVAAPKGGVHVNLIPRMP